MTKLTALFLVCLTTQVLSLEPVPFTINTKKWSHVLDDHFISITVNPTDLLQGKVYGLQMNSTMAILKGLAPAYVRIGSADTGKYTFKRSRYPSDVVKPDDEYTVTETHWIVFNEVAQQAGLDVIVCLNAAHRSEGTKKWDTRNSLELISFSDSQGYNLTWQLGYELQTGDDFSGIQYGKDLNRLRTILNAFPRYQHAKLIGPDIRVIHKKEEIDFWNDVLLEAGPTLDAVTWHPRWPQPSKMKVSDNSELGYEFPIDYLEWDRAQLSKILQKSIFKNPVWIGETKRESTGTFAEGLIWARRLVLAAKLGVEVVMKQPNLMDITHPKPEYWIALLHKRLLGKSVLETKNVGNNTDLTVISHCTNPFYWSDKPEKLQDGSVTVYGVNMGGLEQKIQIKGTWSGKSQLVFQYVLTSGSDPDSVFSQMTYLNGEPLMMTDDGLLPDIIPKIKKLERGLTMKLPPYSVGFWVVPEAKVKICQLQPQNIPTINIETLTPSNILKSQPKTLDNIRDINQFIVDKLKNPESESEEVPELKIEVVSSESSEKDISMLSKENTLPRVARRIRQVDPMAGMNHQIKTIMQETQEFLASPEGMKSFNLKTKLPKATKTMEQKLQGLAEGISDAIKTTNQEQEFNKFLEDSGLKQDFGSLLVNDRRFGQGIKSFQPYFHTQNPSGQMDGFEVKERLRRSISDSEFSQEESIEDEEESNQPLVFRKKILLKDEEAEKDKPKNQKQDIFIPHQPDLKGLEEKYKQIVHSKLQDGKRKIDDIKRKIKDETEMTQKIKPTEKVNDIQEEIIKKEIELLEKTEETVADILKSQKKRQETFEDIIFDELNDVKGERIRELEEMHSQRKKENAIVKRQAQTPLSKPLLKTVEYIEKNFNLEPESVRKIKRSLEERMGEILRNYDNKKSIEVKKRMAPLKDDRKVILRKSAKETDRRPERVEIKSRSDRYEEKNEGKILTKDRPKEKNVIKKPGTSQVPQKSSRKSTEESTQRSRKSEEIKKPYEDENDSFELFNEKKMEEPVRKSEKLTERRRPAETIEGKKSVRKISSKTSTKEPKPTEEPEIVKKDRKKPEEEAKETKEETQPPVIEQTLLKNDKNRREHMLEQITLMVDKMNSKGDESKKKKEDEDISEEFESDRRPRGIRRKPRKAEMMEELIAKPLEEKVAEKTPEIPQTPVPPTTKKHRKHRVRPNRKHKEPKKVLGEEGEESTQRKRHLPGFDRPFLEHDKKKLIKSKFRKFSPKFHVHGNELLTKDQVAEIPIEQEKISVQQQETPVQVEEATKVITEPTPIPINPNEELRKDLEELVEEKLFLEKGSETSKDMSEKSGNESSPPEETEMNLTKETPTPTEGYIIVEPTEELDSEEFSTTETAQTSFPEVFQGAKDNSDESQNEKYENEMKTSKEESTNEKNAIVPHSSVESDATMPLEDSRSLEDMVTLQQIKTLEAELEEKASEENDRSDSLSDEDLKPEEETENRNPRDEVKIGKDSNHRQRRATFVPNHGEEDEEDYSSEERIQKFKQMVYKKSPMRKPIKNEVRPTGGMGMGADEFLRMAGSTVRVMFDDVIPEAYGQTKNKIQNMGISEYIKEFGKIVQQMKNLDQIFLNIGEAAVKGYIRGNKAEKGPYIQVISRKKRGIKAEDIQTSELETEAERTIPEPLDDTLVQSPDMDSKADASFDYATNTGEEITTTGRGNDRENAWDISAPGWELGKSLHEDDKTSGVEASPEAVAESSKTEMAQTPRTPYETKASTEMVQKVIEKQTKLSEIQDEKNTKSPEIPKDSKKVPEIPPIPPRKKTDRLHAILKENGVNKKMIAYVPEDLQEKIFSPWIKTTKDFIQQALTTLQRQRELSEILANDLMNGDMVKRAIGKREAGDEEPKLPVYHMVPPATNKKRETQQKHSDESLIRHLRGLQPGVYVVPTEEMTNIRSEQITNEAKQKSGLPNVVTLNIYYDKKNAGAKSEATITEPKITQDTVTYYQNKPWNPATNQYEGNQYMTVSDVNMPTPVVSPVQINPALQTQAVYAAEPRIAELPNSRLIQYPSPAYHYPPVQKIYPAVVPNPQAVYGPVYYVPQDARYASQPPGTKRQWREFKARSAGVPLTSSVGSGWNLQYDVPTSIRTSPKTVTPSSYNKNYKFLIQDKKRSIGDFQMDPSWSEAALPFWKFFSTSEKKKSVEESTEKPETSSTEIESSEDVFAENRKRAKAAVEKKVNTNSIEQVTEEKPLEEEEEVQEEEEKSRKRRSISDNLSTDERKVSKRSNLYDVGFKDHDILPEWFGTYREIENTLDSFPPHVRRSHIISSPWSDEDEELLSILEADDELSLVDLDTDDYFGDNNIQHPRRYPRSTDQFDSNMIKSNMIYKMPMDGDHLKPKVLGMTGIKKLTDEDSSLEMAVKSKPMEMKTTTQETTDKGKDQKEQEEGSQPTPGPQATTQPPTPMPGMPLVAMPAQPSLNGTNLLLRNPNDDTFYYFFKYAYDSLVKVMKSMTEFF